jgi:nickel-dependent lactate racemase
MQVAIPLGSEHLTLELLPTANVLRSAPAPPLADPRAATAQALAAPIGGPPLKGLAQGRRDCCLVISDITRPVPNQDILPPILDTLAQAGLPPERVTIMVATGMHRAATDEELLAMLGPDIPRRHAVISHDCRDQAQLVELARVGGAPILLNRRFLEADLKIVTGLIEPHTFAGFSGGAKSVLPGLAGLATMEFMHSYAMVAHPAVRTANLEDNPFQQHVRAVATLAGVDFMVGAVINHDKRLTAVLAGDVLKAHAAGCAVCADQSLLKLHQPARVVITSGGGAPLDATFFQSIKGLYAAAEISSPGAKVLLITSCAQGLGSPQFRALLKAHSTPASFQAHFSQPANFTTDQWAAQRLYQARAHFRQIFLHAPGLTPQDIALLGLTPAPNPQAVADELLAGDGPAYVVPEGPYVAGVVG